MAAFTLETFEPQAEAFLRARNWREWQFQAGLRPGRGLVSLYDEDFPDFSSTDLYLDLQDAQADDARRKQRLVALLARAELEARTREHAVRVTRFEGGGRVTFENSELPWREAPARWGLLADVPRRHALEAAWREAARAELTPALERWQAALTATLATLDSTSDWSSFWDRELETEASQTDRIAQSLLSASEDVYPHVMAVYLAQLELPLDDVWPSDADWAFRAARFDPSFPERSRMPAVIRSFRELGIEIEDEPELRLEDGPVLGVQCLPLDVPGDVHVLQRLVGGHLDYRHTLRGIGEAQHWLQTDRSLTAADRWLGDPATTVGYGLLFAHLLHEPIWLADRLELIALEDLRLVQHIDWLRRLRGLAAQHQFERQLWSAEPGASLATAYEEGLTAATRVRHFPETYVLGLLHAPWSSVDVQVQLRAEVFAAQLRAHLRREFDEEWFRSPRAGRFLVQELWRPGRRHSSEELLGFMGYEGFDANVVWRDIAEVLSPL